MKYFVVGLACVAALACGGGDDDDGRRTNECGRTVAAFQACGGDPTGTWSFETICTDADAGSMLASTACPDIVRASTASAMGSLEFTAAGVVNRIYTTTFSLEVLLGAECIASLSSGESPAVTCATFRDEVAADPDISRAECMLVADACECVVEASDAFDETLPYEVDGGRIVYTGLALPATSFCVEGDSLETVDESASGAHIHSRLARVP